MDESTAVNTVENASANDEISAAVNLEEKPQNVEVINEETPKENTKPPPVRARGHRPKMENKHK